MCKQKLLELGVW